VFDARVVHCVGLVVAVIIGVLLGVVIGAVPLGLAYLCLKRYALYTVV